MAYHSGPAPVERAARASRAAVAPAARRGPRAGAGALTSDGRRRTLPGMTTSTIGAVRFRQVGPCLAAEVEGLDLTRPLSPDEVAAVHAGLDRYAVLVFRNQQHISDAQQLAFTQSLGDIEHAIGTSLRAANETRLPTTFADVSNLDKQGRIAARDNKKRMAALGNRLWHSDASFRAIPARYSILSGRVACSIRSRMKAIASGRGQPTMVPICAARNSDLRPVTGWVRTMHWRTGLKRSRSSSVKS